MAGIDQGLLTDDAVAAHFLDMAITVSDHPMTGQKLGRQLAAVMHSHGVGERKTVLIGLRLFCEETRDDADVDLVTGIRHAVGLESKCE